MDFRGNFPNLVKQVCGTKECIVKVPVPADQVPSIIDTRDHEISGENASLFLDQLVQVKNQEFRRRELIIKTAQNGSGPIIYPTLMEKEYSHHLHIFLGSPHPPKAEF